jgi:hypothetical protein
MGKYFFYVETINTFTNTVKLKINIFTYKTTDITLLYIFSKSTAVFEKKVILSANRQKNLG